MSEQTVAFWSCGFISKRAPADTDHRAFAFSGRSLVGGWLTCPFRLFMDFGCIFRLPPACSAVIVGILSRRLRRTCAASWLVSAMKFELIGCCLAAFRQHRPALLHVAPYKLLTLFYRSAKRHWWQDLIFTLAPLENQWGNWHIEDQISGGDSILSPVKDSGFLTSSCCSIQRRVSKVGVWWREAPQIKRVLNHHSIREEGECPLASWLIAV